MPIQNPSAAIQFPGFLSPTASLQTWEGLLHPSYLKGGFQSVPTIAERNAIPIWQEGNVLTHAGFSESGDGGYTTGRRQIGMLVYDLENNKFYTLCPKGYFVNPVDENTPAGGETEWQALSEWVKAGLLKPNSTSIYDDTNSGPPTFTPNQYTPASVDPADPWLELQFGSGNIYNSNLATTLSMTEDVGGMPTGTLVSDLSGVQTYDQLFDTILFPTSYPTASGPSVGLTGAGGGLKIIGSTFNGTLVTSANQGSIVLDSVTQGVRSGDVTAANIAGPGGPYTLGVTAPNGIDDQAIAGHIVTIGQQTWILTATFDQGPMPLDSTGADYPAVRFNGGDKTANAGFEGVYPIFLGTEAGAFTQATLYSHGANYPAIQTDQTYAEVNGSLHHRISIPNDMINGRTIEVWQFSTVSNQYAEATAAWVSSQETRTIESNTVNYTLLSKTGSAGGSNLYKIKFV